MKRILGLGLIIGAPLFAQSTMAPTNDLPNPYQTVVGWAKLPDGRTWGSTSAVDIDKDGKSIWVAERCGTNACTGSQLDPILKFDENGNLVAHFGAGLIQSPHGIFVDKDDNIWITDCSCTNAGGGRGRGGAGSGAPPVRPGDSVRPLDPALVAAIVDRMNAGRGSPAAAPAATGHQIFKFSPDGKLLLTLGKAGGGRDTTYFWQPNDLLIAPDGSIFVAEGHASNATASARVYKFSRDGKLVKVIGSTADTNLNQPHALAMDSKGRLFVGDRANNRIKIYDQNLNLLDVWYQFSRPSGIFIDKDDNIYVADSESGGVDRTRTNWTRGIRIGSARDGVVKYLIPDPLGICQQGVQSTAEAPCSTSTSAAEGVAVDAKGNIYGAEVGPKALKRYVKK